MKDASQVLEELREGNDRFVGYVRRGAGSPPWTRRMRLPRVHRPKAVVLGCSDARVPVEIVFDQGPGELFVVRSAGHLLDAIGRASVAFATGPLEVRCIVVLGHTECAAVGAAVETRLGRPPAAVDSLRVLLEAIGPSVEGALKDASDESPDSMARAAVKFHVQATCRKLTEDPAAAALLESGGVIAGAVYEVETGRVVFLEDLGC